MEDAIKMFAHAYEYVSQQRYSYDEITEVYDRIQKSPKEPEIIRCFGKESTTGARVFLDALHRYFDEKPYDKDTLDEIAHYKQDFQYYPDLKEPSLVKQITHKKEMVVNLVSKTLKTHQEKCNRDFFELAPHQLFLKNLMSKSSPYNGVLIFHGVGVVKTCSAITIAENFKDSYKDKTKRIMILASQNIQIGWRNTIYDPRKGDNQCTGDSYTLEDESEAPIQNLDKQQARQIKAYYELYGYASFANSVKRLLQKYVGKDISGVSETTLQPYIDKHFSNRLMIIDEVHNIRTGSESEVRETIHYIELVIKYSRNLKLVLLTANPMYNVAEEIVWILNMLLLNDSRSKIDGSALFDEDGPTREGISVIRTKCQGYVSYVRGENPVSFPARLYPKHNQSSLITSDNSPINDVFGMPIPTEKRLSFLRIYGSRLRGFQEAVYNTQMTQYLKEKEETQTKALQIQEESRLLQLANIAYPVQTTEPRNACGETGLEQCFRVTKNQGKIQYAYKDGVPEFLDEDMIEDFSAKIKSILTCIRNSDGITFVYTNWIGSGVIPLVLALEQNGYQKYDNTEVLKTSRKREPISYKGVYRSESQGKFIPAKYMVIAGEQENLTRNLREELKVATSPENTDGSHIKVIIGSSVASEGLDFKCIRTIHILEPWHNLNKVEQVIGRGVRNCSHSALPPEERNVTIYLHGAHGKNETIDLRLYRHAEKKAKVIGTIETILKSEAIDRHLFQNMNHLTAHEVEPFLVKPAYRTSPSYMLVPKDIPYTRVCSFQPTCDYLRDSVKPTKTPNLDTFSFQYLQGITDVYIKRITLLIRDIGAFTLSEISDMINQYQQVEPSFLERALQQMVSQKVRVTNASGDPGYLIIYGDMFVFQPAHNPDHLLPYYYRMNRGNTPKLERELELSEKRMSDVSDEDVIYTPDDIQMSLNVVANFPWNDREKNVRDRFRISKLSQFGYIYDRIHYEHRKILGYLSLLDVETLESVTNHINDIFSEWIECAREYCRRFHIGYDSKTDTYTYGHKQGFFLYHVINKRVYSYVLSKTTLSLMNEIDQRQMLSDISGAKQMFAYPKESWSFMLYVSRYKHKHFGMVCKVVNPRDKGDSRRKNFTYPPGEGIIIRDTNRNDSRLLSIDPVTYILNEFPAQMKILSQSQIEVLRKENSKIEYCAMIEMFYRDKNRCLSQDLVWLRYV